MNGGTDEPVEPVTTVEPPEEHTEAPDLATLMAELDETKQQMAEMLDTLQRSRAEMANFRRRMEQEQERIRQRAAERLLLRLLPVIDDFERALKSVPEEHQSSGWVEGIRMIQRKLANVLEAEGVARIEAVGNPFDPSLHEAVAVDDSGGIDTVVEEYAAGYYLNGSVLRPSAVKVGALPPG
jgi:molecular chaperone GrpE